MSTPHRRAFTLIEMLVVIGIILALAALAAAFMPRVNDSQNLSRAVDSLQQWLLTAKMRAKRDGVATGIRFVQAQGDAVGQVSTFQYIQQPDPLSGGNGATLISASNGTVTFSGVDFWLGEPAAPLNPLVQAGDYLTIHDGGVYQIAAATGPTVLQLVNIPPINYAAALHIADGTPGCGGPTSNYRILRQPRILIGEEPLILPRNYAANFNAIPGSSTSYSGTNVTKSANGFWEIIFSPSGAVLGANTANGVLYISLWDSTMETPDIGRVGIVGVQVRTGFIGAYEASPGPDPFYWVKQARQSGM